jgi:PGF-CTERM protein
MTPNTGPSKFRAVVSSLVVTVAVLAVLGPATGTVAAQDDANFEVDIDETNEPVTEGETLEVEVRVENTGNDTTSKEITLETTQGGTPTERDTRTVSLDGGVAVTRTLSWDTEDGDAGRYTINVSSEDDFDRDLARVTEVSTFDVDIDGTNEPVNEGETLTVDATVENEDDASDSQTVELTVDGRTFDDTTVSLDGGASESVQLEWETERGDAGDYSVNVSSETASASTPVLVRVGPTATFSREPALPDVNEAVVFDASGSTDPDGTIVEYRWVVDGQNQSAGETLSYTFTESGDHEVQLYVTDDDGVTTSASRTITVNARPEVSLPEVNATTGDPTVIEPTVNDDGTIARYEWYVDGGLVTTEATLSYAFAEGGRYQVRLQVTDDNGATRAASQVVRVSEATTPTPTPTPTADPGSPDEPSAPNQPGFGAVTAIVAMVGAALLARRR